VSGVRVDVWLWSVRLFKTRSAATSACRRGAVRVNGKVVKASRSLAPDDTVAARIAGRERVVEVVEMPSKRVGAPVAAKAYIDNSPPPDPRPTRSGPTALRERGSGRPTKRDRRQIERFTGRAEGKET